MGSPPAFSQQRANLFPRESNGWSPYITERKQAEEALLRVQDELERLTFVDITHPADLESDLDQAMKLGTGEIDHYEAAKGLKRPFESCCGGGSEGAGCVILLSYKSVVRISLSML